MTDKEKDLNTEQDKPASNLKVAFKPSGEKTEPFAVKKTPEQIKIENNEAPSNPLDINSNLGSFGPSDLGPDTPSSSTPSVVSNLSTEKVSTLEKIQEKNEQISVQNASNVKINFDKFERNKNVKVKTRVGIKFDSWLRQPKMLLRIWLVALGTILILWAAQICYLIFVTYILKHNSQYSPDSIYHSVGVVGNIFSYISIGLPVIPFLFLLTTAIIGINGMLSSRMFHYFLWSTLLLAFVCFLVSTCCSGFFMDMNYSFATQPK